MASTAPVSSLPGPLVLDIIYRFLGSDTHRDYGEESPIVSDSQGFALCFPKSHYGRKVYRESVRVLDFKKSHGTEECERYLTHFPNVSALRISLEGVDVYDHANFTAAANPGKWSGEHQAYPMALMCNRFQTFSIRKGGLYAKELNALLTMLGHLETLELEEIGICLDRDPARANDEDAQEQTYCCSPVIFGSCSATLRTLTIKRSSMTDFPATRTFSGRARVSPCFNLSSIPFAQLETLTRFHLEDMSLIDNSLLHLTALPNLEILYLTELVIEDEELVPVLQALKNLRVLVLSRNLSLSFEVFLSLGTKLKHLDISRSNLLYPDARGTDCLAFGVEKKVVESIIIEDIRYPSFRLLLNIFDKTRIVDISLNLCNAKTAELELLFTSSMNLKRLSCLKVGGMNASVIGAISRLRKLTEFNLNFSDFDGADEALAIRECLAILTDGPCSRSLRKLDISGLSVQHNECARHLLSDRPGQCVVEWPSETSPRANRSAECFTLHSGAPGY